MSKPLKTIWGEQLDPEHVLEEYPRPQMARGDWMNLNGYWDYAFCVDSKAPDSLGRQDPGPVLPGGSAVRC